MDPMADDANKEEKKRVKAPTAAKRHKQDVKKTLRNRVMKSKLKTARTAFAALPSGANKDAERSTLYSYFDKAVKKGLFTKNKAARLKSRLTERTKA
jgi:small subunit ribosomal protein S20